MTPPVVVTIAGSDSGGGAGLQADLRTFAAHRVHGATVITVVTAQNSTGVRALHEVPVAMVQHQLDAVLEDLPVAAVKTGMLGSVAVVDIVSRAAAAGRLPNLVVDPVLVDASGRPLFDAAVAEAYAESLIPRAAVVTPNLDEAALLTQRASTEEGMGRAAADLGAVGAQAVVVKGGRLGGRSSPDVVWRAGHLRRLEAVRVDTGNDHGTGCSLAASIAALLAHGHSIDEAIDQSKAFVAEAIDGGGGWQIGAGHGPIDHLGWSASS